MSTAQKVRAGGGGSEPARCGRVPVPLPARTYFPCRRRLRQSARRGVRPLLLPACCLAHLSTTPDVARMHLRPPARAPPFCALASCWRYPTAGRYWQWASTLLGSRLIRRTLPPAIFLAALALGIQLFNVLVPEAYAIKGLPLRSFALSTTFVGLLLVFRTNGSYQRFQNGLNSFIECLCT